MGILRSRLARSIGTGWLLLLLVLNTAWGSGQAAFALCPELRHRAHRLLSAASTPAIDPALDTHLRSRWADLKATLIAGDSTRALEHILTATRDRYATLFAALGTRLTALGADMPDIEPVYIESTYAQYRLRRQQVVRGTVQTITHYVYFALDTDGIWRIESF